MRIISGKHKGRRLIAPSILPVRPTSDRAKESLFNIIQNRYYFEEKNMLDLYSGTGNIAYEFASRGCIKIMAVDNNYNCINYIEENSNSFGFDIKTIKADCLKYLENCKQEFNFIFADPPYNYNNYKELKKIIFDKKLVKKDGILIIEHDKETKFEGDNLEVRKYGNIHFSIFSF